MGYGASFDMPCVTCYSQFCRHNSSVTTDYIVHVLQRSFWQTAEDFWKGFFVGGGWVLVGCLVDSYKHWRTFMS